MQHTTISGIISSSNNLKQHNVDNVIKLLEGGATIPFISRYRKEATGNMDEVQIGDVKLQFEKLTELFKRKTTILDTIEQQGKLTGELKRKIEDCYDPVELEDIYLPYKPKRRTRATMAREKGLEPLALKIFHQEEFDPLKLAATFVGNDVKNVDEALRGAIDIIAEMVSEDQRSRNALRMLFAREAVITSKVVKGKESEGVKYSDYFDSGELLRKAPSHRMLAMLRGEKEGYLRLSVYPDNEKAVELLKRIFVKGSSPSREYVKSAIEESYKRLLGPSMETEVTADARTKADDESIDVFATNLRQLLLSPPLGQKSVMAIDPGYRTGCKVACLDGQGIFLDNTTIYPHTSSDGHDESAKTLMFFYNKHHPEAIAIGDGTAGKETLQLVKTVFKDLPVEIFSVSEDGASIYSASPLAREEFPDLDVTVRGAISIGRRLMDPLAELVKIDPKSIGVGQYQHDVDQSKLKHGLDTVVESCVNAVGANLNTASKALLSSVSGLGPALAGNIVEYRSANGPFLSRKTLLKVSRLGEKAYEQCAGFMRIDNAKNPLDNSAVHPESYHIVEKMAQDMGATVKQLLCDKELRLKIDLNNYTSGGIGLLTLKDIMQELEKPGRDPREQLKTFEFADGINSIDDLHEGMVLPGIVTNIIAFGAFVNIGIKQDGLVHISQLSNKYVSNPSDVVSLQQHVWVKVTQIDSTRGRIGLSMKDVKQ